MQNLYRAIFFFIKVEVENFKKSAFAVKNKELMTSIKTDSARKHPFGSDWLKKGLRLSLIRQKSESSGDRPTTFQREPGIKPPM